MYSFEINLKPSHIKKCQLNIFLGTESPSPQPRRTPKSASEKWKISKKPLKMGGKKLRVATMSNFCHGLPKVREKQGLTKRKFRELSPGKNIFFQLHIILKHEKIKKPKPCSKSVK